MTKLNLLFKFKYRKMCECKGVIVGLDIATPRNVYLSPNYRRSFAFQSVKNRMPSLLTSLLDNLVRYKVRIIKEYGEEAKEELKTVIGKISELKYEIQTNKPIVPLTSKEPDAAYYNQYIADITTSEGPPTHFNTVWLLQECYMYRRIRQMFEETTHLKDYDPFQTHKEESYNGALKLMTSLGAHLLKVENSEDRDDKEELINLLKIDLWGNKVDLSLSEGLVKDYGALFDTKSLDPHVLCDNTEDIWNAISSPGENSNIIDWVLDNAGYELFTDFCLADFIVTKKFATTIRFYVKTIPWYISDTMTHDIHWTIESLAKNKNSYLQQLSNRWKQYFENQTWIIVESAFWTLPYEYCRMMEIDPDLYKKLGEAKIAIFKGDLNYRKLMGEKNWDPATPVETALQGFHPTKLGILRTLKADLICGLKEGVAEKIEKLDSDWLIGGNWGVIHYCDKVMPID